MENKNVLDLDFSKLSASKTPWLIGDISFPNPENEDGEILIGTFKIYDGFAIGTCTVDGVEREISAQYPLAHFVNKNLAAKGLKDNIHDFLGITEDRDVTVSEILASYAIFNFIEKD